MNIDGSLRERSIIFILKSGQKGKGRTGALSAVGKELDTADRKADEGEH